MTNQVINVLVAGIIGAVAFITVRAIVFSTGTDACGDTLTVVNATGIVSGSCGAVTCNNDTGDACSGVLAGVANGSEVNTHLDCWSGAECTMMVTVLPLVIAIFFVVAIFMVLTKVRAPG